MTLRLMPALVLALPLFASAAEQAASVQAGAAVTNAQQRVGMSPAPPTASADPAAPAAAGQPAPQAQAPVPALQAPQNSFPGPAATPGTGSLLQTLLALCFVLALLVGLAWFVKRFGPRMGASSANLRVVGSLNLGGRERIVVVEVADQWIVVGASPGRINLLSTMPRQEGVESSPAMAANVPAGFADWLKQTIDKRNAK